MRQFGNAIQQYYGEIFITAPVGAAALNLAGAAGSAALFISANSTAGSSFGMDCRGGTNASDSCAAFRNQSGGTNFLLIMGDGGLVVGAPTGGDQGLGTINATGLFVNGVSLGVGTSTGTFNATFVGGTGFGTVTCQWNKSGNAVTMFIPGFSGTSNATSFSVSNLPSAIQATTSQTTALNATFEDNGASNITGLAIVSGASLFFGKGTTSTSLSSWTATGTKGCGTQVWTWTTN